MQVKQLEKDGVTVFEIDGEVNLSTSPELKKQFEKSAPKKLVVDLQKVQYIDSSGLATLVEILKKTRAQGGQLGLAGLSDKVRSLFEITKLDKLFVITKSREDALSKIK